MRIFEFISIHLGWVVEIFTSLVVQSTKIQKLMQTKRSYVIPSTKEKSFHSLVLIKDLFHSKKDLKRVSNIYWDRIFLASYIDTSNQRVSILHPYTYYLCRCKHLDANGKMIVLYSQCLYRKINAFDTSFIHYMVQWFH